MKKLRTAVIGLGRIGWKYHIPQILKHGNFELTAVVDPLRERCIEAEHAFAVRSYLSPEVLFQNEKPDVVVIASPTQFHREQTILALENGCDVFCDKPLALNAGEAEEMNAAAVRMNRKIMVYQPHRASRETVSLLDVLRRGLIGPVYMIKLAVSDYTRRNDWQAFKKNGGGMLANYGSHFIDQLLYLTAFSPIENILCRLKTIASCGDADDVVKALMINREGVILDLDINMASAHKLGKWHIWGKSGCIVDDGESWLIRYFDPEKLKKLAPQKGFAADDRKYRIDDDIQWKELCVGFKDFADIDFYTKVYEYFAHNCTPFVPLSQTLDVMRIIQKCRDHAG